MSLSHTQERAQGGKGVCPPPWEIPVCGTVPPTSQELSPAWAIPGGGAEKSWEMSSPPPPLNQGGGANIFFNIFT